jgi:uncharacterized protein YecA (UPF0149 family)
MDTNTGHILSPEEVEEKRAFQNEYFNEFIRPMNIPPTPSQMKRRPPRIGRNEPCPCGSGIKFKKCCLGKR